MAFEQIKYQNKYIKEHYARLSVQVPLEDRVIIDNHWKRRGYKSFNAYVNDLIRRDMNNDDKNISVGDISQNGNDNTINIG